MPSQEAKLLSDFLLAPAALGDFMTLRQFTAIFPQRHRSSPAVQDLYRELQRLREQDLDRVRGAIADEVARSRQLRREYASERRRRDHVVVAGLDASALRAEEELSHSVRKTPHTLSSICDSIDKACHSLESHIAQVDEQHDRALAEVHDVVGALSDLRHGRFAQPAGGGGEHLGEEVLAVLGRLDAVCTKQPG